MAYLLLDWKSTVNEWKEDKKKLEEEIKEWREPERMDKKIKPDEMRENIRLVKDELWEMRLRIGRMVIRLKKMEMRMGHMDVETILGKKDALEYEHDKKELMHMSLDLLLLQDDIRIMRTWDDEVFNSDLRYHLKVAQMQRMGKNGRKMGYHVSSIYIIPTENHKNDLFLAKGAGRWASGRIKPFLPTQSSATLRTCG